MLIFFHTSRCSGKNGLALHSLGRSRGFTLIEMMVVLAIMLFITMAFLVRQQKFDSSTILRSLAYSVALSVRQAQVYGTSVRENTPGSFALGTAAPSYGVFFNNASSYILFADNYPAGGNGAYDAGNDTVIQTFSLNNGYTVSKFCATTLVGAAPTERCGITALVILFKRPNPDALISTDQPESYLSARAQVQGPGGDTRSVSVSSTGQIIVGALGT